MLQSRNEFDQRPRLQRQRMTAYVVQNLFCPKLDRGWPPSWRWMGSSCRLNHRLVYPDDPYYCTIERSRSVDGHVQSVDWMDTSNQLIGWMVCRVTLSCHIIYCMACRRPPPPLVTNSRWDACHSWLSNIAFIAGTSSFATDIAATPSRHLSFGQSWTSRLAYSSCLPRLPRRARKTILATLILLKECISRTSTAIGSLKRFRIKDTLASMTAATSRNYNAKKADTIDRLQFVMNLIKTCDLSSGYRMWPWKQVCYLVTAVSVDRSCATAGVNTKELAPIKFLNVLHCCVSVVFRWVFMLKRIIVLRCFGSVVSRWVFMLKCIVYSVGAQCLCFVTFRWVQRHRFWANMIMQFVFDG